MWLHGVCITVAYYKNDCYKAVYCTFKSSLFVNIPCKHIVHSYSLFPVFILTTLLYSWYSGINLFGKKKREPR